MPNEQRHYSNELNLESVGINLPYNMQAEQSVLGAVLLKPETLTDLVEIIRPEMFYTRQNAQIYSEMLRLFTADQTRFCHPAGCRHLRWRVPQRGRGKGLPDRSG